MVARNPDAESSLPFLLAIPVGDDPLVLKAREPWPRTAKVYCHRADGEWPADPDIVDDVGVKLCRRRGVAIDLVLERGRENRSQFVFTRMKNGREAIFWQTARTARASRPGVRVPGRRASWLADFVIVVDTRERYPYRFAKQQVETERRSLPVGDYGVLVDGEPVGIVERKSLADLARAVTDGGLAFRMAELSAIDHGAVVVEDRYSAVFKHEHVSGGYLADLLARIQVRYPTVPIVFCESRPLAEEWTFRFLGAALAQSVDDPDDPTAPRIWKETIDE